MADEGRTSDGWPEPIGEGTDPASEEIEGSLDRADAPSDMVRRAGNQTDAMRELAMAFHTSAETLRGVRDLQGELVRALKRQDRSELVLRSTEALNDTFRNLTMVQRELLDRLSSDKGGGGLGRVVPVMLIGLLVVFLGGTYLVLTVLEQMRTERQDPDILAQRASERTLQAFREGGSDRDAAYERDIERLQEQLEQMRAREEALRSRIDTEGDANAELLGQVRTLEAEREGLAGRVLAAQKEVLTKHALETELRSASSRLAVIEPRVADLQRVVDEERAENTRLRKRLAAIGYGLPDPEAEASEGDGRSGNTEASTEPAPAVAAPEIPASPPRRVDRDPTLLLKIRDRLNQMLDASSRGRDYVWQVTRIDGVSPDRLVGVIAMRYDRDTNRLLGRVTAEDLQFWVDRDKREVELEFHGGTSVDASGSKPFPGGVLRSPVASGEMTRLWSQSGFLFMRFR